MGLVSCAPARHAAAPHAKIAAIICNPELFIAILFSVVNFRYQLSVISIGESTRFWLPVASKITIPALRKTPLGRDSGYYSFLLKQSLTDCV
jgi:subtilase family serine protease